MWESEKLQHEGHDHNNWSVANQNMQTFCSKHNFLPYANSKHMHSSRSRGYWGDNIVKISITGDGVVSWQLLELFIQFT
jgi:hypothetical protein